MKKVIINSSYLDASSKKSVFDGVNSKDMAPFEDEKAEVSRHRGLQKISAESIKDLIVPEVTALQGILGHGNDYGYWCTPKRWRQADTRAALLRISLRDRIIRSLPAKCKNRFEHEKQNTFSVDPISRLENILTTEENHASQVLDLAVLTVSRYLLLLRMGPSSQLERNISLEPSTICALAYQALPRLSALVVANLLTSRLIFPWAKAPEANAIEIGFFRHLSEADLKQLSASAQVRDKPEIHRIKMLANRGFWTDEPDIDEKIRRSTNLKREKAEDRAQRKIISHLPLPDVYVSEMGRRSIWLIKELAPSLFRVCEKIKEIWSQTDDGMTPPSEVQKNRRRLLSNYLKEFVWQEANESVIISPPFELKLSRNTGRQHSMDRIDNNPDWPPRGFANIIGLLHNVQLAHLFVVALSTGGRRSETLNLQRNCVEYSRNGMTYVNGLTYKLVKRHEGLLRDWVLPNLAAEALEQQVRLASLAEQIDTQHPGLYKVEINNQSEPSNHLWVQTSSSSKSDRKKQFVNLEKALQAYAKALGLDSSPGGQNIRPHRLRKTIARLAALALTQSPKILMDVFGHKSIEQTLYYILTDKALAAEIEIVSRELRVMRAKEVVSKMVDLENIGDEDLPLAGYGGPAALMVNRAIETHSERLHQRGEDWGADTPKELAEILTLQGASWDLVRPGIICTKFPGTESGPCNQSLGRPEPARCQSHCSHRLEEPFLREDVNGAIKDSLQEYTDAQAAGDELLQSLWERQILIHLNRFEDLREKWMHSQTIREIFENHQRAVAEQ